MILDAREQHGHQYSRRVCCMLWTEIPVPVYGCLPFQEKDLEQLSVVDEVHFWLNGYVNKQNCRIWSEANPKVYVETPLHPEKLTVWCALWAGGILLQKR
ncbi:uncharacterized protein TNCV_274241 [Trichonephila clavipes]|nr:uncharacterized protein TNCV_274241 [Trichonephila clavipes]